jgi:hypothetical protein
LLAPDFDEVELGSIEDVDDMDNGSLGELVVIEASDAVEEDDTEVLCWACSEGGEHAAISMLTKQYVPTRQTGVALLRC